MGKFGNKMDHALQKANHAVKRKKIASLLWFGILLVILGS